MIEIRFEHTPKNYPLKHGIKIVKTSEIHMSCSLLPAFIKSKQNTTFFYQENVLVAYQLYRPIIRKKVLTSLLILYQNIIFSDLQWNNHFTLQLKFCSMKLTISIMGSKVNRNYSGISGTQLQIPSYVDGRNST